MKELHKLADTIKEKYKSELVFKFSKKEPENIPEILFDELLKFEEKSYSSCDNFLNELKREVVLELLWKWFQKGHRENIMKGIF